MLEMMDKAINDISSNDWSFRPSLFSKNVVKFENQSLGGYFYNSPSWSRKNNRTNSADLPEFNMYDEDLFVGRYDMDYMLGGAVGNAVMLESASTTDSVFPNASDADRQVS